MADTFQYKVRDRSGTVTTGSLIADSEALVLARLREQGLTPLDVRRKKKSIGQIEFGGKKVKLKEVAIFSRQFATMVNSGYRSFAPSRSWPSRPPTRSSRGC